MLTEDKTLVVRKKASAQSFGAFGLETIAYIKPVTIEGKQLQSVHAADGTALAIVAGRDIAFATVRQHDLEPASVH